MPGYREKRGVCLYKLISQTKRDRVLPAALDQNRQTRRGGGEGGGGHGGPPSTWQNKMGPQRDSELNISVNKRAVYCDDTSEGCVVLAVNLGTSQSGGAGNGVVGAPALSSDEGQTKIQDLTEDTKARRYI